MAEFRRGRWRETAYCGCSATRLRSWGRQGAQGADSQRRGNRRSFFTNLSQASLSKLTLIRLGGWHPPPPFPARRTRPRILAACFESGWSGRLFGRPRGEEGFLDLQNRVEPRLCALKTRGPKGGFRASAAGGQPDASAETRSLSRRINAMIGSVYSTRHAVAVSVRRPAVPLKGVDDCGLPMRHLGGHPVVMVMRGAFRGVGVRPEFTC